MHDRLANDGRQAVRFLTIVDAFTRECLALHAAHRFRSQDVIKNENRPQRSFGSITPQEFASLAKAG